MTDKEYIEKFYKCFNDLFNDLSLTRNFVCSFGKICVDKITEYKPKVTFHEEFSKYLYDKTRDFFKKPQSERNRDELQKEVNGELNKLLRKHNITLSEFNEKVKEEIASDTKLAIKLNTLQEKMDFYLKALQQIYLNSLENTICSFENFVANVFIVFYSKNSSALNNKSIKFEYINDSSSLEEARNIFIKNEVEELMRKSIKDIFTNISQELNIKLDYYKKHSLQILEAFYRRNIFVHNNGVVNKTYITLSKNPYGLSEGDLAQITEDYIYSITTYLLLLAVEMVTSLTNKSHFTEESFDEENNKMSTIAFVNYLQKEDWVFAKEFYEILNSNKYLSDVSQDAYNLNIMLCDKKMGNLTLEEIKKQKWSSKKDFLLSGYYGLSEEYEKLSKLLIKNCDDDEFGIGIDEINTWPIFIDFRLSEYYKATIEKIEHKTKEKHINN